MGRGNLGMNLGRPIGTNGDFATRLFPNYYGQDLLLLAVLLKRKRTDLSTIPCVGLSVCRVYTVAKRLIGSGCRLGL